MRETLEPSAVWGRRLRYVPGGILHPGGTQTDGGEEIERNVTSAVAPLRFSPAESTEQAAQNRRPHIKKEKSPLLRSCHGYFPG